MKNKEQKSNAPIFAIGTALVLTVALFTGVSAYKVVEHINADADEAYAAAITEANMRRLAESQTQQASELRNMDSIPVEVTVHVVDERQRSEGLNIEMPEGYTVGDMVNIDGEWYIISRPEVVDVQTPDGDSDQTGDDGSEVTEEVDEVIPDSVTIDGETYVRVSDEDTQEEDSENPEVGETDTTVEGDTQVPYVGADYVTIDADGNMVYLVERGDTLTRVSNLTGYSIQELAEYNHIENVNLIYTGQSLRIPASAEAIAYVQSIQGT